MKSFASLARLGLLGLVCATVGASEPVPLPPPVVPAPPAPDCLPKDPPPPVVKVKVRVAACSAPDQPIEYRICVENCSPAEAHHVVLKNPLPANARFVRADPEPTTMVPELQWHLGTVGGGATREVVLVLLPTNREDVKNCTRVQFEHGQCVTTRQAAYPPVVAVPPGALPPGVVVPPGTVPPGAAPPVMPPATDVPAAPKQPVPKITPEEAPQLQLAIEGHKRQYVNLASHYFLTVTNAGKTRATNVLVSCVLPDQTKFVRASHDWKLGQGQVAWVLGDLEPGAQRTVELVLRAQVEGLFCVRATARADLDATAQAEACTQFIGVSALHIDVTDRDDPIAVGTRTSYVILVRNQGSAAVTNLRVKVFIPAGLQLLDVKGPTPFQAGEKTAQGQWVATAALERLEPTTSQSYEVFVEAKRAGEARVQVEVSADQLERGPVLEQESTTVFEDEGP
jgi:uncharacterized repeat protein (TIGR01451 family)